MEGEGMGDEGRGREWGVCGVNSRATGLGEVEVVQWRGVAVSLYAGLSTHK